MTKVNLFRQCFLSSRRVGILRFSLLQIYGLIDSSSFLNSDWRSRASSFHPPEVWASQRTRALCDIFVSFYVFLFRDMPWTGDWSVVPFPFFVYPVHYYYLHVAYTVFVPFVGPAERRRRNDRRVSTFHQVIYTRKRSLDHINLSRMSFLPVACAWQSGHQLHQIHRAIPRKRRFSVTSRQILYLLTVWPSTVANIKSRSV